MVHKQAPWRPADLQASTQYELQYSLLKGPIPSILVIVVLFT